MEQEKILVERILQQAEDESRKILTKADKESENKYKILDSKIENIKKETDQKISDKIKEIERQTESTIKTETRRQKLKNLEKLNSMIKKILKDKMRKMIGTDEYNDFIAELIAEGALAVGEDRVFVNFSSLEKVDDKILAKASDYIKTNTGKDIEIAISGKSRLMDQGIVVESENGRISYNNQIETRLRRFDEDVKGVISKWIPE